MLSVFARLLRRGAFEEFETGTLGARTNSRDTALRGFTRGTSGTRGSTNRPATRNPDAQENKERATMNSPIMKAFLSGRN